MRHKILVIDDFYEERSKVYDRLRQACLDPGKYATPASFEIDLVYANASWQVDELLRQNSFSAVVLDVVLSGWKDSAGEPVRASDMLAKIDNNLPVALLSSEWLSKEVKAIVSEWPTKNCRMFIHWDDILIDERVQKGSVSRIIHTLAGFIGAYKNIDFSLVLESNDPIRILHISDLQFGGFGEWKQKLDASHCATTIRKLWNEGPTFIAITGDIAERGLPEEFDAARAWIAEMASQFGWRLPSGRILLVPGNHDICIPLAASSTLMLRESDESKEAKRKNPKERRVLAIDFVPEKGMAYDLLDYALRPYNDFCENVAPRPLLPFPVDEERKKSVRNSLAWVDARYRNEGVVFFGLNTARPILPHTVPGRDVAKVTVEAIVQELQKIVAEMEVKPLIIGLTHHYPLRGPQEWAVDQPDHFAQLFSDVPNVALWLHGHWHMRETTDITTPGGKRLVINSAPSLTVREEKRPPDTARGFSMIELKRQKGTVTKCEITSVEWVGTTGLCIREAEAKKYKRAKDGHFNT